MPKKSNVVPVSVPVASVSDVVKTVTIGVLPTGDVLRIKTGKVDATTINSLGVVVIKGFADGNFTTADTLSAIRASIVKVEQAIKKAQFALETAVDGDKINAIVALINEMTDKANALHSEIADVVKYRYAESEVDKAVYGAYKEFFAKPSEANEVNYVRLLNNLFAQYGLELTNGALVNIGANVGLKKASLAQMSKDRVLVTCASKSQYIYQLYAYLAKSCGYTGFQVPVAEVLEVEEAVA